MQWFVDADHPDPLIFQAVIAADLLISEKLMRLKQCLGKDCGQFFLESKNQKRILGVAGKIAAIWQNCADFATGILPDKGD
ncbi:hypothetical protein [Thermoflavifilum thermophilum]|uniref:Uncharacterized protein n=1 Tax=Thermoflavifilum thermophilum TaxID=1393122 RepID=A0A1I7NF96_9BACT|nr:hypothetical protein [Thermoflavifilum thermophilum]SFV33310.1 hypothetical protein SAMN05660895_1631 [Thermoflavifilum thermophilum]